MSELVTFLKNTPYPYNLAIPSEDKIRSYGSRTINGVSVGVYTKHDGDVVIVDNTSEDLWNEKYHELVDLEFPNAPFTICLSNDELLQLDEPFTDKEHIIIKDDRGKSTNCYGSYLRVQKKGETPITLRQILNAMIQNDDYKLMNEKKETHCFLETLHKMDSTQFGPSIHYCTGFGRKVYD